MTTATSSELPELSKQAELAELRRDLAAAYRLMAHFGWADLIFTHYSVRVPGTRSHFLINGYGLHPSEITASSLVMIDVDGNRIDASALEVNPAGFTIHSAVHMAREDAHCVLHTHTLPGMAVAALEQGLLPVNQINMEFYDRLAYYDLQGIALDLDERAAIVAALGQGNAMILRNHGLLTVGSSVAEAFYFMYYLNKACEIQLEAMKCGTPLRLPPHEVCEHVAQQASNPRYRAQSVKLIWDSMLRMLDRIDPGYRD